MPTVGRRQLGMRTRGHRIPMSVAEVLVQGRDGVERLLAAQYQRLPHGEVRRQAGQVDGVVAAMVGVMILLGYVNFSFCLL